MGSHQPSTAHPGVAHEGYGGWTWSRFLTDHRRSRSDGDRWRERHQSLLVPSRRRKSASTSGRFEADCEGQPPDVVTFSSASTTASARTRRIQIRRSTTPLDSLADKLLAAFDAPDAILAVADHAPERSSGRVQRLANYQDRYPRLGWK